MLDPTRTKHSSLLWRIIDDEEVKVYDDVGFRSTTNGVQSVTEESRKSFGTLSHNDEPESWSGSSFPL